MGKVNINYFQKKKPDDGLDELRLLAYKSNWALQKIALSIALAQSLYGDKKND